ncbi:MAG: hypothetical protein KGZ58_09950 [Ignavibacteriales bacterium]|nr:hypothetical protein [Ignavibacteriales bacterium]
MNSSLWNLLYVKPTDNYLLFSLSYFIAQQNDFLEEVNVDIPIKELFSDKFPEEEFILTVGIFELHHGINIPDNYLDYGLTLREFVARVSALARLTSDEYAKHIKGMRDVAMRAFDEHAKKIMMN